MDAPIEIYRGRRAVLATMHGKERAIAGPMRSALGLEVEVSKVDTDAFGTFTGEIERVGTMRETAIAKARLAMKRSGSSLGLASEGSYGAHPYIPFLPAGIELMVFVDEENGYTVDETHVCERTNFNHITVTDVQELAAFLDRVRFPEHALVVQPNRKAADRIPRIIQHAKRFMRTAPFRHFFRPERLNSAIYKGVQSHAALKAAFDECSSLSQDGRVTVATDMRAFVNPTRMDNIRLLAVQLARRLACPCPACRAPGYGPIEPERGLPCTLCGCSTDLVMFERMGCIACEHVEEKPRADGMTCAAPDYCNWCNP